MIKGVPMPGDILDVIVGALLAGAGKVLKDATAGAYQRLIDGLRDRFGKAKVDELERIAQGSGDEEVLRTRLAEVLADANITMDDEVVAAAREVRTRAEAGANYYIVAQDSPIGVIGPYGTATLNFGSTELEK
jgi:hypothetical protein